MRMEDICLLMIINTGSILVGPKLRLIPKLTSFLLHCTTKSSFLSENENISLPINLPVPSFVLMPTGEQLN